MHHPITTACAVPLPDAAPRRVMPSAWLVRRPGDRDLPFVDFGLALAEVIRAEGQLIPTFEGRPYTPARIATLRAGGTGEEQRA